MQASSHRRRDHRSCATRSTPCSGSWASLGGCDASATNSRCDLQRPRRPAETPWQVRWPMFSSLPAQRAPAALWSGASQRPSESPPMPLPVGLGAWSNGCATGVRARTSRVAATLQFTPVHAGVRATCGCTSCHTLCHHTSTRAETPASCLRTLSKAFFLTGKPCVAITVSSAAISLGQGAPLTRILPKSYRNLTEILPIFYNFAPWTLYNYSE